jgi:hypothetical protein
MSSINGTVVAEGTWLYAGSISSRIVIVRRDTWYGTGDYEDPPEVSDDQDIETFEILYASPGQPNQVSAGGGQYRSLGEARLAAEAKCGSTLRWINEPSD